MKFASWLVGWLESESVSRGMYKETISHFDIPNRWQSQIWHLQST